MVIQGKHAILVVDDESSIRENLERLLRSSGYEPVGAADGQEALDRASEREFELVLLDIKMPVLSGIDVLRRLRSDRPDACVIMATAVPDVEKAVETMKLGAYDYILKPFNMDDVLLRVERALERSRLMQREREYQRLLEREVKEKTDQLQARFFELVQSLAREHTMALELEALRRAKRQKGLFSSLPPELQQPTASVQEFAQALIHVLESGSLAKQ